MNTKQSRVRKEDLHHGMKLFVASVEFGIEEYIVDGKPYMIRGLSLSTKNRNGKYKRTGSISWFVPVLRYCSYRQVTIQTKSSLMDMGIITNNYNGRRTFRTRKQAEAYIECMRRDPKHNKIIELKNSFDWGTADPWDGLDSEEWM